MSVVTACLFVAPFALGVQITDCSPGSVLPRAPLQFVAIPRDQREIPEVPHGEPSSLSSSSTLAYLPYIEIDKVRRG